MKLSYRGGVPVTVRGPRTGTEYRFSGSDALQLVDPRDAVHLLKSRRFQVAGIVKLNASEKEQEHG